MTTQDDAQSSTDMGGRTVDEQQTMSAAPGDWYAVVVDPVTVAVPAGARDRVAGLWQLAESGAGFDALLDALLVDGLAALPDFVLVQHGDTTRVLVRGGAAVSLTTAQDTVEVAAEGTAVWAERSVADVLGGQVVLQDVGTEAVPAVGQVLRVSRIEFGESGAEQVDSVEADLADAEPAAEDLAPAPVVAADEVEPTTGEDVAAAPEPEEPAEAEVLAEPDEPAEPDVPAEPGLPAEPEPELAFPAPGYGSFVPPVPPPPPAPPEVPSPPSFDAPPAYGAPTPPPAYSPALGLDDDVEDTIIGSSPVAFERPPSSMAEQAQPLLANPVAQLVMSTGDVIGVDRAILIGRAPEARRFASDDKPALVVVPSPHQEISSTHLEIRPGAGVDHGMAVVTDLGSTNGTVLVQPGLPPEELQAGVAVALIPGAILDLGDGVTVQVTNA